MTPKDSPQGQVDPPEKKPWGRNPLKPWAYWTLVIVSIAIVVTVIAITVSMGKFV